MKLFKRFISIMLVVIVFVGSFVGNYNFFSRGTYAYNVKNISVFDEDVDKYYLRDVKANIIFRMFCEENQEFGYQVIDSEGNYIDTVVEKVGKETLDILPPDGGYHAGEEYTLILNEGVHFWDENLSAAKKLVFVIEKEAVEKYTFTDAVIEADSVVKLVGENEIDNSDIQANVGDVIFGKDEESNYVAYKVVEINGDIAEIESPSIDEIYSELEVYGEYSWDVDEIVTNPDIEVEIVENIKNSDWYALLIETAYAGAISDDVLKVTIEPDSENNALEISIEITLKAGDKGLFGDEGLKNQNVIITLDTKLSLVTKCNIQGVKRWDVSATLGNEFSWNVDIGFSKKIEDKDLNNLFEETDKFANLIQYHKNVKSLTEKLNNVVADINAGEIKLFDWKLPIPSVPGLYFDAEINLVAELELAADITIGQSIETMYIVGVCFQNNQFETYSNQYFYNDGVTVSLKGKAEVKAGVGLEFGATLINSEIANISIEPKVGLYEEIYVTFPISNVEEITDGNFMYSYYEPGIFFAANVEAKLNIGLKELKYEKELVEKKFKCEKFTFGNEQIALGTTVNANTVRAIDKVVTLPDVMFEYYDVKKGGNEVEKLSYGDIKFATNDGTALRTSDGKITLPDATTSNSCYITATYLHSDGMSYSTIFKVLISGSVIEGKVSAYASDMSTQQIESATVSIYSVENSSTPIASMSTDEGGKFSFNVAKGEYRLVISADGYKTLISNQIVEEDEIKYTEHILLMDSQQTGCGTVSGTVTNALNGNGIEGVGIRLRENWNNNTGDYVGDEVITTSNGRYVLQDIPVGYYTVEASLEGFVTGYTNIIVVSTSERNDFDFTITPRLNTDEIRIVLTWGQNPADLDSHLIGYTPDGDAFNVYYSDKLYYYNGTEMANLDVDDTSSYGPETITILEEIYGTYTYVVHDYTNRNSQNSENLSNSSAIVRVFIGSEQVGEYHVPTDQIGQYWTVFNINEDGDIVPINSISNTRPES